MARVPMDSQPTFDRKLAYLALRFTLGLTILMHGLVGLPHLSTFADATLRLFVATHLPSILVRPFALTLVFLETAVGHLLVIGQWTRTALLLGAFSMASLIFGTALRSDWAPSPSNYSTLSSMPPSLPPASTTPIPSML
ncbi:MAG: hypothetical protein WA765_11910 [Candidatus Acidiferrum sp.]